MPRNIWMMLSVFISFLFLLSSYIPNFYEASIANLLPQERTLTRAEHMYTYDYNVYLSKIKQGSEGRWSVVDKYTNDTEQKGVFLQLLYLWAGKVGGLLGMSPGLVFHTLRTVLSSIWVLIIIYLNFYIFKKPLHAFTGVLLSLFAASWPVFYDYQNSTWIGMHMSWWQELDVLKRISYIPHYTLNYIIIGIFTVLLHKFQETRNKNSYYLIVIILFFSFFIHPSSGLLFLISWLLFQIINFLWNPKANSKKLIANIYFSLILLLTAAIPLLYFQYITSDFPWKSLVDYDKFNRIGVNLKDYVLALGPIFFTGVTGGIIVLLKKEEKFLTLVTWILGAFLAIITFKQFPLQSELRFVQTANHIPLAILSVYFLAWLIKRMPNIFIKLLAGSAVSLVVFLGIAQSYFSIRAQTDFIHQRVVAGQPLVPYPPQVMYPLKDMFNAFIWLEKNTKNEEVVLSQIFAGNYIPAYSGNYVYFGHNPETPHYGERMVKVERFYSGRMPNWEAQKFLNDEKIAYVLYGPQEKEKAVEDIKKYEFLTEVFSSNFVVLFSVGK